jgi:glycosyltransferase involved in cell wall biosynthesis
MISLNLLVLNEAAYLPTLLQLVRPYVDEIVVGVDDRTTDDSAEIAKRYADVVLPIRLDMDFAKARNTLIEHSKGDWILHLDADEVPMPCLLRWLRYMSGARGVDAVLTMHENRLDGELLPDRGHEWHVRLFRRVYRYVNPLHEVPDLRGAQVMHAPRAYMILHHKTRERQEMQNRRYEEWKA